MSGRRRTDPPVRGHKCLPPRWLVVPRLYRCRWFGHRFKIAVRCCRYVVTCSRCGSTVADLPRGEDGLPVIVCDDGGPEMTQE